MWTKMGPVWLLKLPPGPIHIAKDVGLHDTLLPLKSTYVSPGPPKNESFHILHVEIYFKMFVGA